MSKLSSNSLKTSTYDYQAEDSRWYPSTDLRSYFVKKNAYASLDTAVSALKELYDAEWSAVLAANGNPFLKMMK